MIVKCNVGGSLTLANLGDLILEGGQIVNLGEMFPEEVLARERRPPHGCLHLLLNRKLIIEVAPGSKDYKKYEAEEDKKRVAAHKEKIMQDMRRQLIAFFRKDKSSKIKFIRDCDHSSYDLLMEIHPQEQDKDVLSAIHEQFRLMSDYRIQSGFVLL